jgi:hypothetical protein
MIDNTGAKIPPFLVIPSAIFVFWLGGLSYNVAGIASEQESHGDKPAHETTISDVATIKSDVKHNKETIDEIKQELKEGRLKAEKDKQEILQAIREQ